MSVGETMSEPACTLMLENVNKQFNVGLIFRKRLLHVLRGINLQVHSSSIFGLLGPSGCGKTTLLKCIVGRMAADSGIVKVFGCNPGSPGSGIPGNRVGYMPQDISLTEELSVVETLHYFGKTAGMDSKGIKKRTEFLLKLLHLERFRDQLLGNLSGGQRRRISFAVAIIHEPPLLIFDEPTVGLDPIMRKSIWDYLLLIANTSFSTIIITTHYIEEAKSAGKVGLMLNGKIVALGSPDALIEKHNSSSLEEVFLTVSRMEMNEESDDSDKNRLIANGVDMCKDSNNCPTVVVSSNCRSNRVNSKRRHLQSGYHLAMTRFIALILKTVIFSFRNPASIVLEVIVPPLLLSAFAAAVGKPLFDLQMGVINQDESDLGQLYLSAIDTHTINLAWYDDVDQAAKDYQDGVLWGIINLNRNFSDAMIKRTTHGILSDNVTLEESQINVQLDTSNSQVTMVVHTELLSAFLKFSKKFLARQGFHSDLIGLPLKVNGEDESSAFNYNQFLMPAFILSLTYFTAMGSTAMNRAWEKQMGCTDRLCVAGVSAFDLVFSELFVHLILFVLEAILDFIVLFWIFEFDCKGSMVLAFLMVILHGVCGMGFGIFVSAVTDYVATAMITCIAFFFVGIMIQGVLWPLEGVPYALRYASMSLTTTLPGEGMRGIVNRGWGITFFPVYMGFVMSIVWSFIFLLGSLLAFNLRL